MTAGDRGLLVSGRATRAEEFLHLEDQKLRDEHLSRHRQPVKAYPGKPRQEGSRRWKKAAALKRAAEARSRRRVKLAANTAAHHAIAFASEVGASRVVMGDPKGIERKDSGAAQNRRTGRWLRAGTRNAVRYRMEERGISFHAVDERGTSSVCPFCGSPALKAGRVLRCRNPTCAKSHHRDLAGSQNIARANGGVVKKLAHVEHRRVGQPSRRDRRRRQFDASRGEARTRAAAQLAESLAA